MLILESYKFTTPKPMEIGDLSIKMKTVMIPRMAVDFARKLTKKEYESFLGENLLKMLQEEIKLNFEFKPEPKDNTFPEFSIS